MWDTRIEHPDPNTRKYRVLAGTAPLRYAEVVKLWQHEDSFRSWFSAVLAGDSFAAYRWETPPVTAATLDRAFEFALIDEPGLDVRPDPGAFASHLQRAGSDEVVSFRNLGGDALLIVPVPAGPLSCYGHLADFVREAPETQVHALWKLVGQSLQEQLSARLLWLSTAGMGVPWLHVRLDSRPKYYAFKPYRKTQP